MFSLLTPLALWLAPLIALPLILHLTGRARPVERDFPSLLPVRATLTRAMRRRRVRDWLQLILRTLALLCLLLAVADPLLRRGDALRPPAVAAVLRHNGAWDAWNARPASIPEHAAGGWQERLRAGLDSLTSLSGGRAVGEDVLPDAAPGAARFGRPGEALARLLRRHGIADAGDASIHVYAPVFAARDLAEYAGAARPWLEAHPHARLIVVAPARDGSPALTAFDEPRGDADVDGNLFTLRAAATGNRSAASAWSASSASSSAFPPVWRDGSADADGGRVRTARRDGDTVTVSLPLPEHGWIAGTLAPADDDPRRDAIAFPAVAAAWRVPPPATLCVAGGTGTRAWSVQTARAMLGAPGPRTRIRFPGSEGAAGSAGATGADDEAPCRLLYLADPDEDADGADDAHDTPEKLTARAVAVVRRGGLLVLEAGPRLDPVRWNRGLLAPLGVGRLTGALRKETIAARPRRAELDRLGLRAAGWGEPGRVKTRHGFHPDAATSVLLAAPDGDPLLVHRRVGGNGGAVLLWLTSLSDPAWSDLATRPWAALLHRALVERAGAAGIVDHAVDADSLAFFPATEARGTPSAGDAADDTAPRLFAPDGTPFAPARVRPAPGGWLAGPFDAPGLYRIETIGNGPGDDSPDWLAVRPAPTPRAPGKADWEAFRELLGDSASARTVHLETPGAWRGLYGGLRLRLGLLVMAALLLLADGLVSLRLSPSRT